MKKTNPNLFVLLLTLAMVNMGCIKNTDEQSTQLESPAPSDPVALADKTHDKGTDSSQYWLDLAKSNALKSDAFCQRLMCVMIGENHLMKGDLAAFHQTYEEFDCTDRLEADLPNRATGLTLSGNLKYAELMMNDVDDPVVKDRCRLRIAMALLRQHQFEVAAQFDAKLVDPSHKSLYQEAFATALADSGKWAEAKEIVSSMSRPESYEVDNWDPMMDALREHVQLRESTQYSKGPTPLAIGNAQTYRRVANLFGASYQGNDLDTAAATASQVASADDRAVLWRAIAWYRIDKNEQELARQALTACTEAASKIEDPGSKSIQLVLAADAWLELGDVESAKSAILRSNTAGGNVMPAMQGLTSFITGPIVVGVYVRSGETEMAFQQLCDHKSDVSAVWTAFGAFCSEYNQIDFVKKHFSKIPSSRDRAFAAMGVATTLLERERANK